MIKLNCKKYVDRQLSELAEIKSDKYLAIIQVGDNPASCSYVKNKGKDAARIGKDCILSPFPEDASWEEVFNEVQHFNGDRRCSGLIIQMPVPAQLEGIEQQVLPCIDVDGFTKNSPFKPCTPEGIINYLKRDLNFDFEGKDVVVIGRGALVGKPIAKMLMDLNATVTVCHSKTEYIHPYTKNADLIICATGLPHFFDKSYFNDCKPQIIVDAGISFKDGKLCGDVDMNSVRELSDNIRLTPVPGGVGLLTRLTLMEHTFKEH